MDELVKALGPAFAAGFAVQRVLEILDAWFTGFLVDMPLARKRGLFVTASLVFGFLCAWGAGLHILQPLGIPNASWMDTLITTLVISAGTEGLNSVLKFLGYAKDNTKAQAAQQKQAADGAIQQIDPGTQPPPSAFVPSENVNNTHVMVNS